MQNFKRPKGPKLTFKKLSVQRIEAEKGPKRTRKNLYISILSVSANCWYGLEKFKFYKKLKWRSHYNNSHSQAVNSNF